MNTVPRVLKLGFAGTPQFAVPALDALLRSRHTLVAVFTQPDRRAGRGQVLQASPVKLRAQQNSLAVHQPATFKSDDSATLLRRLELDALVVVAYGLILPQSALAIPRLGCLNIHASLLPRWRGAAPIQRAILAGDRSSGVTIMRMEATLDTGPILAQREVGIAEYDTAATLSDHLARAGAELIVSTLDRIAEGAMSEHPQPNDGVTYAEKINKAEAKIDWQDDAADVVRRVRAFNPWPVAETALDGVQLRVWEAELVDATPHAGADLQPAMGQPAMGQPAAAPGAVLNADTKGIDVACGRGVLRILRLQLAGRKALAAADFIKAHRLVGSRLASA